MTLFYITIAILPIAALIGLTAHSVKQAHSGIKGKKIIVSNLVAFMVVLVVCGTFTFAVTASAADTANTPVALNNTAEAAPAEESQESPEASSGISTGLGLIAAALVTGLAGVGGGIAVAAGAPAAIAATSEDPKSFGKSLIFVALGESIALYGVVISILILNKV